MFRTESSLSFPPVLDAPGNAAPPLRTPGLPSLVRTLALLGVALALTLLLAACGAPAPRGGETAGASGTNAAASTPATPSAPDASTPTGPGAEDLPAPVTEAQLTSFAELALACIDRPFPYKPSHVLRSPEDLLLPQRLHPAFFGCFDWHSAVHAHWMLLRLVKTHPELPLAESIRDRLDAHFTPEALATEAAYFSQEGRASFERPYGWAWLLRLAAEIRTWDSDQGRRWAANIAPLESAIAHRYESYLGKLDWPIRTGVHPNTAFALAFAHDYAAVTGNTRLAELIEKRSRDYYFGDASCPVDYEPGGEDFFSPCLLEADLMRRVLPASEFSGWLDRFLPGLATGDLGPLATPAHVSDPSDPKIAHLDGLNLVRAWTLRGIASALPPADPRRAYAARLAAHHTRAGLDGVLSGHYEGEHWLASFAVYLTTVATGPTPASAPTPRP